MPLKVKVIDPDKVVYQQAEIEFVLAPGLRGNLGILPGHTPMYSELVKGEIIIQGKTETKLALESGILKVHNDEVTILIGI